MTEIRVAGSEVTSYELEGLEKYTWYEVSVQPFFQSVVGRESKAQVRTLDDGIALLLSSLSIIIMSPLRRHIFVCFMGKNGVFRP